MTDSQLADPALHDPSGAVGPTASSLRTVALVGAGVLLTLLALVVVDRARSAVVLIVGAGVVAVLVQPAFEALQRVVPRALAVVALALLGIVGTVAVVGTVAWDVDRRAEQLAEGLESGIAELPTDSTAAEVSARVDLPSRAGAALDDFAAQVVVDGSDPLAVASWVSRVVVVVVLAAFMLVQGPALVDEAIRQVRRSSTRARLHRGLWIGRRAAARYVGRTVAVGVVHGVVVGVSCAVLDLPGAVSLGAWVAVASAVPVVGGVLGWAPIVAIATATGVHPVVVAVCGVAAIALDRWARRRWVRTAVHVGPVVGLLSIGLGFYAHGIPGAVIGLTLAAAGCAALEALRSETIEAMFAPRDLDPATPAPVPDPPSPGPRIRTLVLGGVAVVAVFVVHLVVLEVRTLLVWTVLGCFIAVGLDRPVTAIQRRTYLARPLAVCLVLVVITGAMAAFAVAAGPAVTNAADSVVADAPDAVGSMERLPLVGPALRRNGVADRAEDQITALPDRLTDSALVDRLLSTAGDGAVGAVWTLAVVIAVLLDGPRLVAAVGRRVPVGSRRRAHSLGRAAYTSLSNVAAATAFVAVLNGSVVMLLAVAVGVPLAPVLAAWAAAWNVVPQVGGFVGATPLVLLALARGPWHALVCAVVFVAYQTLENHVIQPAVGSRAVDLPPLVVLVAVLIGGSVLGLVGAILAAPTAGVIKVAFVQFRGATPERLEDRGGAAVVDSRPVPRRTEGLEVAEIP